MTKILDILDMSLQKIINLGSPASGTDAATKDYVDVADDLGGMAVSEQTGAFTPVAGSFYLITLAWGLGIINVTLPVAPPLGTRIKFARMDNNNSTSSLVINPGAGATVYAFDNLVTLLQGQCLCLVYVALDGANRWLLESVGLNGLELAPNASFSGLAKTLMLRTPTGTAIAGSPVQPWELATKGYVDLQAVNTAVTKTGVNFTAVAGTLYLVDCTTADRIATLPITPAQGTRISFQRVDDYFSTKNLAIFPGAPSADDIWLHTGGDNWPAAANVTFTYIGTMWYPSNVLETGVPTGKAVAEAAAGTVMSRDSASRAQVADPAVAADIATKGYVDGFKLPPRWINTTAQTAIPFSNYLIDANAANINVVLPTGAFGDQIWFSRYDAAGATRTCTIAPQAGDYVNNNLNGVSSLNGQYDGMVFTSNGAGQWFAQYTGYGTSANSLRTLMRRDVSGRAQVTDPAAAQDIATKNYVDTTLGAVQSIATSSSALTATAGTALKDTGCADYNLVVTDATLWYRVKYVARAQSDAAATTMDVTIRDGGASSPTNASTAVAGASMYLTVGGGTGATQLVCEQVRQFTAGTHKLAAFYVRTTGGGLVSLSQSTGQTRQLYVEAVGH